MDVKGGEVYGQQLFECLAASDGSRGTNDMADVVRGVKFIDDVHVSFVPNLVFPAQNKFFVFFSGHGLFLLSLRWVRVRRSRTLIGGHLDVHRDWVFSA